MSAIQKRLGARINPGTLVFRVGAWITLQALAVSQILPPFAWADTRGFDKRPTLRAQSTEGTGLEELYRQIVGSVTPSCPSGLEETSETPEAIYARLLLLSLPKEKALQPPSEDVWKLHRNSRALARIFGDGKKAEEAVHGWARTIDPDSKLGIHPLHVVQGLLHPDSLAGFLKNVAQPEQFVRDERKKKKARAISSGGGVAGEKNSEVLKQADFMKVAGASAVLETNNTDDGGRTELIYQLMLAAGYGHTVRIGDLSAPFKAMFSPDVQEILMEPDHSTKWANLEFWKERGVTQQTFTARVESLLSEFVRGLDQEGRVNDSQDEKAQARLSQTPNFVQIAVELLNIAAIADKEFIESKIFESPECQKVLKGKSFVDVPSVRHLANLVVQVAIGTYERKKAGSLHDLNKGRARVGQFLLERAFGLRHQLVVSSLDPQAIYAEFQDPQGNRIADTTAYAHKGQVGISLAPDGIKPLVTMDGRTVRKAVYKPDTDGRPLRFVDPDGLSQGTITPITPKAEQDLLDAIENAEKGALWIYGPSSFVVSLSAAVLLPGIVEAILQRPDFATTLVLNLTRNSETLNWTLSDYIQWWEQQTGKKIGATVKYLIINTRQPRTRAVELAQTLATSFGKDIGDGKVELNYPVVLGVMNDPKKDPARATAVENTLRKLERETGLSPEKAKEELILALSFADHGERRDTYTYKNRGGLPRPTQEELRDLVDKGITVILGDFIATEGMQYVPGRGRGKVLGTFHDGGRLADTYDFIYRDNSQRHRAPSPAKGRIFFRDKGEQPFARLAPNQAVAWMEGAAGPSVPLGAGLEEEQVEVAARDLFGVEDLVAAQRWPAGVSEKLGISPGERAARFIKTQMAKAKAAGVDLANRQALKGFLFRETIPWRVFAGSGRAQRVSATGLDRKVSILADGYTSVIKQAREASNWGELEDIVVIDELIAYRLLRERVEVTAGERARLADEVAKLVASLAADVRKKAELSAQDRQAMLLNEAVPGLKAVEREIHLLVADGWKWSADKDQQKDVAGMLRKVEEELLKALPETPELAQYIWEHIAAHILRYLVEYPGPVEAHRYLDLSKVRDLLGDRVILAVAIPDGPGGALRDGIHRLKELGRLHEHAYVMPVYGDYASASLPELPNAYLTGVLEGMSNPENPAELPDVVIGAKSPLKSLPSDKGNIIFLDPADPRQGAVAIREWRQMSKDEQIAALSGWGRSASQNGIARETIPQIENWGKLNPDQKAAVYQGYDRHVPGDQPFYHALNAGIFLFKTSAIEQAITEGIWTPYDPEFDHPDDKKFKLHEYWYTDMVSWWLKHKEKPARVVQLGETSPDGVKDTGRIVAYRGNRHDAIQNGLPSRVTVEPGATVTISNASATAPNLERVFQGTVTLRGRIHLDSETVTIGDKAILDGRDQPVVLTGETFVPAGATITGVSAHSQTFTGSVGGPISWRVSGQVPAGAVRLDKEEVKWLQGRGILVVADAQVYLLGVGASVGPEERRWILEDIFEGDGIPDQVWLEGAVVLEPAVRIQRGTWLNGRHRPVVLRGKTVVGQGRSVAAAELTDTLLEPIPVLDGFNYQPPRVDRMADVWNAILVGQQVAVGEKAWNVHGQKNWKETLEALLPYLEDPLERGGRQGPVLEQIIADLDHTVARGVSEKETDPPVDPRAQALIRRWTVSLKGIFRLLTSRDEALATRRLGPEKIFEGLSDKERAEAEKRLIVHGRVGSPDLKELIQERSKGVFFTKERLAQALDQIAPTVPAYGEDPQKGPLQEPFIGQGALEKETDLGLLRRNRDMDIYRYRGFGIYVAKGPDEEKVFSMITLYNIRNRAPEGEARKKYDPRPAIVKWFQERFPGAEITATGFGTINISWVNKADLIREVVSYQIELGGQAGQVAFLDDEGKPTGTGRKGLLLAKELGIRGVLVGDPVGDLPPEVIQSRLRRGPEAFKRFMEIQIKLAQGKPVRVASDEELKAVLQGVVAQDPQAREALDLIRQDFPDDQAVLERLAAERGVALSSAGLEEKKEKHFGDVQSFHDALQALLSRGTVEAIRWEGEPPYEVPQISRSVSGTRIRLTEGSRADPGFFSALALANVDGFQYFLDLVKRYRQDRGQKDPNRYTIVMARDTRPGSGPLVEHLAEGMQAAADKLGVQIEILYLGIVPKPVYMNTIRWKEAHGGVNITASHNSLPYPGHLEEPEYIGWEFSNGWQAGGALLPHSDASRLIQHTNVLSREPQKVGEIYRFVNEVKALNESALLSRSEGIRWEAFTHYRDGIQRILVELLGEGSLKGLHEVKVVFDSNGSSAGPQEDREPSREGWYPAVWAEFGLKVDQINPKTVHDPNPEGESLDSLAREVKTLGADLGTSVDIDADRVGAVLLDDSTGEATRLNAQQTATLVVWLALEKALDRGFKQVDLVLNETASLRFEQMAKILEDQRPGIKIRVHRAGTGEANVVAKMHELEVESEENGALLIGAEPSHSGVILPGSYCYDACLSTLLIAQAVAEERNLPDLLRQLPGEMSTNPSIRWRTSSIESPEAKATLPPKLRDAEGLAALQRRLLSQFLKWGWPLLDRLTKSTHSVMVVFTVDGQQRKATTLWEALEVQREIAPNGEGGMTFLFSPPLSSPSHQLNLRPSGTTPGLFRFALDAQDPTGNSSLFLELQESVKEEVMAAIQAALAEEAPPAKPKPAGLEEEPVHVGVSIGGTKVAAGVLTTQGILGAANEQPSAVTWQDISERYLEIQDPVQRAARAIADQAERALKLFGVPLPLARSVRVSRILPCNSGSGTMGWWTFPG